MDGGYYIYKKIDEFVEKSKRRHHQVITNYHNSNVKGMKEVKELAELYMSAFGVKEIVLPTKLRIPNMQVDYMRRDSELFKPRDFLLTFKPKVMTIITDHILYVCNEHYDNMLETDGINFKCDSGILPYMEDLIFWDRQMKECQKRSFPNFTIFPNKIIQYFSLLFRNHSYDILVNVTDPKNNDVIAVIPFTLKNRQLNESFHFELILQMIAYKYTLPYFSYKRCIELIAGWVEEPIGRSFYYEGNVKFAAFSISEKLAHFMHITNSVRFQDLEKIWANFQECTYEQAVEYSLYKPIKAPTLNDFILHGCMVPSTKKRVAAHIGQGLSALIGEDTIDNKINKRRYDERIFIATEAMAEVVRVNKQLKFTHVGDLTYDQHHATHTVES